MGNIIDKKLAYLESFFDDESDEWNLDEEKLPTVDKEDLVEYGV
jgi:hypothetical protein